MKAIDRKRVLAYLIDFSILFFLNFLFIFSARVFALDAKTVTQSQYMWVSLVVTNFLLCVYIPTKQAGSTIGKMLFKLQVVNISKQPRTMWQSFLREWVLKFSLFMVLIPFNIVYSILVSIKEKHFSFYYAHDIILKTNVVYRRN